jgi:hypothetical protein
MDVHPPHEPIRSWKDFLLHLLTITIGLLIALGLDVAVEAMHHRHMVRDAQANLRKEISENHALYAENKRSLADNRSRLEHDIEQLRDLRAGKTPEHLDLHWGFYWGGYADAAWKTARDIGAVPYMTPEMIEQYDSIYGQQALVNEAGVGVLLAEAKAAAPLRIAKDHHDPKDLLTSDVQVMLLATAELDGTAETLQSIMKELDDEYVLALKEP